MGLSQITGLNCSTLQFLVVWCSDKYTFPRADLSFYQWGLIKGANKGSVPVGDP